MASFATPLGKSFLGANLAKIIYENTKSTIMCVCHTNHALDSFLLELLDIGFSEAETVRIGGNKVDPRLESMKLQEHQTVKNSSFNRQFRNIMEEVEGSQNLIDELWSQRHEGRVSFGQMMDYLKVYQPAWYQCFYLPHKSGGTEGFKLIGPNGKPLHGWALLDNWFNNRALNEHTEAALEDQLDHPSFGYIFAMSKNSRKKLFDEWSQEVNKRFNFQLTRAIKNLQSNQDNLHALKSEKKVTGLLGKRLIGCTTTGAAIHRDTLAGVKIDVLLVEEAGEILEPAILTALSKNVEHMILIGDHQQLRPKINDYKLQVASRQGYDLDCSLFERLVKSRYPHVTLQQQHRMHPEISHFVRQLTYPKLEDAPKTITDRPMVKGIQSRVAFIDHNVLEDNCQHVKQRGDEDALSKVNTHEVNMIIAIARYLLQQGYQPSDLVILTPYLGQLAAFRDAFARLPNSNLSATLGELDAEELAKAEDGLKADDKKKDGKEKQEDTANKNASASSSSSSSSSSSTKSSIRMATIDNYQVSCGSF